MIDFLWMDEENPVPPTLIGLEAHLGLENLLRRMYGRLKGLRFTAQQLQEAFTTNPVVIENRQAVIADLVKNPGLTDRMIVFYNKLTDWQESTGFNFATSGDLLENVFSVDILFDFYEELQSLTADLKKAEENSTLQSPWLKTLLSYLGQMAAELHLEQFITALEGHVTPVKNLSSYEIGLNFDESLEFTDLKLLRLGGVKYQPDKHSLQKKMDRFLLHDGYYPFSINKFQNLVNVVLMQRENELEDLDLLPDITRNLLTAGSEGLQQQVRRWMRNVLSRLTSLQNGLAFYLGAREFVRFLEDNGLPCCYPQAAAGKCFEAQGLINPFLIDASRRSTDLVSNDLSLDSQGEIAVITGANEGGKTTFLVSVVLAQFLYQLGMPVPAESARISITPTIALVFASSEQNLHTSGRLGQELAELSSVLRRVRSSDVFFAFNEPLTGTSSADSLTIMTDVMSVMKAAGARGLLVTHLFSLADQIDRLNQLLGGSRLKSMVAVVEGEEANPLYKIVEGLPQHTSYAREAFNRRAST